MSAYICASEKSWRKYSAYTQKQPPNFGDELSHLHECASTQAAADVRASSKTKIW